MLNRRGGMEITHHVKNGIYFVSIKGDILQNTAEKAEEYIHGFIKNTSLKGMVINVKDVSMIDSFGIVLIITSFQILQKMGKKLTICQPNEDIEQLLILLHVDQIITVCSTEQEALSSFDKND